MLTLLTPADYRRVRWKNGRGWTTELAARPINGDFDWRVSTAGGGAPLAFSGDLPARARLLHVLRGRPGLLARAGNAVP